ncbi:MAG: hypothetical protein HKM93_01820 [Desulfobacteraceae bacterium]|nr:hypothetical protein [Desulfobacteraceae bacterium]
MKRESALIRRILIFFLLLVCTTAVFGQDQPPRPNTSYDKYLVERIPIFQGIDLGLAGKGRFSDMAITPDGKTAWLCDNLHSMTISGFDIVSGKHLKRFGQLFGPSFIHYHPVSKRLNVVEENRTDDQRGAIVRIFDPATGQLERSMPVPDWRLRRVSSAAFSPDGGQLWLTSSSGPSSLYGEVSAALFHINLNTGRWQQLHGPSLPTAASPPSFTEVLAYPEDAERILRVATDSSGDVYAINLKWRFLSVFPGGADKPLLEHELDFEPSLLCPAGKGKLLIAGRGKAVVIDTTTMAYQQTADLSGTPTAVCTDSAGKRAFIAMKEKADVLVMHTEKTAPAAFARPVHLPMDDIGRLFFLDNPERLAGIAYHGYRPFVLNLKTGAVLTRPLGKYSPVQRLRINHRTQMGVVTFDNDRIAIVNLKPGGTSRTILVEGRFMDAVFIGDDTALVSDMRNKRLLRIDLLMGRPKGSIPLKDHPYGLASSPDGKSVGVVFGPNMAPKTAVVNLVSGRAKYYSKPRKLPEEWHDLHERASGKTARGEKSDVSIRISRMGDNPMVTLRLLNGKTAVFTLPDRYESGLVSVAIGPDELFAYVLSNPEKPVLFKFRLGPAV